jgi:hypothetical protein
MKLFVAIGCLLVLGACGEGTAGSDAPDSGGGDAGADMVADDGGLDVLTDSDSGETPDALLEDVTDAPDAPELADVPDPTETWLVGEFVDGVTDDVRGREISYTAYYPEAFTGAAAVVLVSHGGQGSARGHTSLGHLGGHYASRGYLAIHIGHRTSPSNLEHRRDRPADVSFLLDRLEDGTLPLPAGFEGTADTSRVGHVGHSWGAYTAHAVGGGEFEHGSFRDPRILAICPISPQGPEGFGAYDNGPDDNTWGEMEIPAFNLLGEVEKNGPVGDLQKMEDWRLQPFLRYPAVGDKYLAVLPGQNHGQMGGSGSDEVKAYIAVNTGLFLDVYVRGRADSVCEIGQFGIRPTIDFRRKFDPTSGLPRECP